VYFGVFLLPTIYYPFVYCNRQIERAPLSGSLPLPGLKGNGDKPIPNDNSRNSGLGAKNTFKSPLSK